MTSDSTLFMSKIFASHIPSISIADGSSLTITQVGHVFTPKLSITDNYLVPKVGLKLLSVGPICDMGFEVHFSSTGCVVEDTQTKQIIGIECKDGRLFELISLHVRSPSTAASSSIYVLYMFGILI